MARVGYAPAESSSLVSERKRKGHHGSECVKKSRKLGTDSSRSTEDIRSEILLLENGILESRKNYNSIIVLLEHARVESPSDGRDIVALVALYRVFCRLMVLGNLSKGKKASGAEHSIVQWLKERLKEFEEILLQVLQSPDPPKQSTALNLLMRLVKEKATHLVLSEDVTWRNGLFNNIVQSLAVNTEISSTMDEFIDGYVTRFDDVRYHTFACLA